MGVVTHRWVKPLRRRTSQTKVRTGDLDAFRNDDGLVVLVPVDLRRRIAGDVAVDADLGADGVGAALRPGPDARWHCAPSSSNSQ